MKYLRSLVIFVFTFIVFYSCTKTPEKTHKEILYVGTYSVRGSQGIYVYEFNRDSLTLKLIQTVNHLSDPSYLTVSPDGKFLYAANGGTVNDSLHWGSASAYKINPESGKLTHMNDRTSFGSDPCHIEIDHTGHVILMTNYNNAVLTSYILNDDGSISDQYQVFHETGSSIVTSRQSEAHVHSSLFTPDNKYVYVADLGSDKVRIYDYNSDTHKIDPSQTPAVAAIPGSGPRHMAIFPGLPYMYLVQELSNTVSVFSLNPESAPEMIQTLSTLPADYDSLNDAADIHIAPSGKFLYSSNRGHNSIAIFSINHENGNLSPAGYHSCGGNWPRNFLIDPKGQFIFTANKISDNLAVLKMDADTGELSDSGVSIGIPSPVCIKYLEL